MERSGMNDNGIQRSAMLARGVGVKSATMERITVSGRWPLVGGCGFPRSAGVSLQTPWATTRAKRPKCGVFPEDLTPLGQLADMARWGYLCEICLTSLLFWLWANSPLWSTSFWDLSY